MIAEDLAKFTVGPDVRLVEALDTMDSAGEKTVLITDGEGVPVVDGSGRLV